MTASGTIYSFLLTEKSGTAHAGPQGLRQRRPERAHREAEVLQRRAESSGCRPQLTEARERRRSAPSRRATETVATFQQQYPARLQFAYGTPKYEKPFLVRAIWHDGQFTYIKSDATELPALYEVKDGKPALVNFQVQQGTYVVPKVLERGLSRAGQRSASRSRSRER